MLSAVTPCVCIIFSIFATTKGSDKLIKLAKINITKVKIMVFLVPFEYRHIFLVRYTIGFSLIFILLFYPVFIYCKRIKHYNTMLISRQVNKKGAFCANISYAPQTILSKQCRDPV